MAILDYEAYYLFWKNFWGLKIIWIVRYLYQVQEYRFSEF